MAELHTVVYVKWDRGSQIPRVRRGQENLKLRNEQKPWGQFWSLTGFEAGIRRLLDHTGCA